MRFNTLFGISLKSLLKGCLIGIMTVIVLQLSKVLHHRILNPNLLFALAVVWSANKGNKTSGLCTAAIAIVYTMLDWSLPGYFFSYSPDNAQRLVIVIICMPLMAILMGSLKSRSDSQLKKLSENENSLNTLYSKTPAIMHSIDESGRIVQVSDAWLRAFGYKRGEVIGQKSTDFLTEESQRFAREVVLPMFFQNGFCENIPYQFKVKDGSIRDILISAIGEYDSDGRFLRSLAFIEDITEKRLSEAALQESERRLRIIIESSSVPYAINDEENIIYLNPAFTNNFGYTKEDIPTLDAWWPKAYPDPDYRKWVLGEWLNRLETSKTSGKPFESMEVRIHGKDGTIHTVLADAIPLEGLSPEQHLVTLYDITPLKNVNQRLETLLETASDGIHVLDEDGNVVELSHSFARMLGYTREEVLSLNVADWDVMIPRDNLIYILRTLIIEPSTFETRHRRKDGSIFDVEINAKGIELNGKSYLYASSRDITERKAAEQKLKGALDEASRLNRLMQGREERVIELKKEINSLCEKLGQKNVYQSMVEAENGNEIGANELWKTPSDLDEITDLTLWQKVLDAYCKGTGVSAAILDPGGKIMVASNWRKICTEFHRVHPESAANCLESDTALASRLADQKQYSLYTCRNGLNDAASPVIVNGNHIANVFVGQFLTSPPERSRFLEQARKFGYDETEYLYALNEVPILDEQTVQNALDFLCVLAELIASSAFVFYQKFEADNYRNLNNQLISLVEDNQKARFEAEVASLAKSELLKQLKESEERFRAMFDDSPDAYLIMEISDNGRISACNKAAEIMLRGRREEIIGMTPDKVSPERQPDGSLSSEAAAVKIEECIARGKNNFEWVHRRFDGEDFWAHVAISVITIDGRQVLLVAWRDITERKYSEAVLQATLNESSRLNRLMQGREIRIVELKKRINELCMEKGLDQPHPAVEESFKLPSKADSNRDDSFKLEELIDIALWQRILDSFCDAMGISAAIIDLNGKVLVGSRWRRICTDFHRVGEKSQHNCIESDTLLATELGRDRKFAIYTCRNGMTDAASPIIIDGRHIANVFVGQFLVSPPEREKFEWQAGEFGYDTAEYLRALEEIPVLDKNRVEAALNFMSSYAETVALLALDSLHRRETEKLLRSQQINLLSLAEDAENARNAAEMANQAKSEFLANMSHEIRTPLNGVIGIAHLMSNTQLSIRQKEYLRKIQSSSKALLGVLNDILDYSKIETGHMELENSLFFLDDILSTVSDMFSIRVEEQGIEMFFEVEPDVPHCFKGDSLRLNQVLTNLVANAVKFTHDGEIHISVRLRERTENTSVLEISVKDTGIGISDEIKKNLFSPFTQADSSTTRKFGGTGLGLTISKRLVELMDGDIWVTSKPGSGSNFSFTVKLEAAEDAPVIRDPFNLKSLNILVADDSQTSKHVLRQIFESWSFRVTTASNDLNILETIKTSARLGNPFELLLLDWKTSEPDVVRAVGEGMANGEFSYIPIIVMVSPLGREQMMATIGDIKIDGAVNKPVIPSEIFDMIMNIQNGRPFIRSVTEEDEKAEFKQMAGGLKVLLVEDNSVNQIVATEMLESVGVEVTVAANGNDAIEMSSENSFDVILMDLQMPEMDGFEATKKIRSMEEDRHVPILAMTAAAMIQDRDACLKAGMDDHISKPIDPDELMEKLLRWTNRSNKLLHKEESWGQTSVESGEAFHLPGFNLTESVVRMGGSWKKLKKALAVFAENFANSEEQLKSSIKDGRIQDALMLVHTLKGVAGNLGANDLYNSAMDLEIELQSGLVSDEHEFYNYLFLALKSVKECNNEERDHVATEVYDGARVEEILIRISTIMKKFEMVPPELISELQSMISGTAAVFLSKQLEKSLDRLDYTEASATIRLIANALQIDVPDDSN